MIASGPAEGKPRIVMSPPTRRNAAAPTLAAFAWQYGGYELVLVMAITASILGLIALATAWRYAA